MQTPVKKREFQSHGQHAHSKQGRILPSGIQVCMETPTPKILYHSQLILMPCPQFSSELGNAYLIRCLPVSLH